MIGRVALSLASLAALGACDGLSGPNYEISMEMRDLDGAWLSGEEKAAMEAEFLAEWADGPQCVGAGALGNWESVVDKVSQMGGDEGCRTDIVRQDETSFTKVMRCTGASDGDLVSDGSQMVATTTASTEGETLRFETRFEIGHQQEEGSIAYTLAGTGRRVESCGA